MLYDMAKRYDEWPGETLHEGSSARGAMKGWHKHGVCAEASWPQSAQTDAQLTVDKNADARPGRLELTIGLIIAT